jgi:MFS family permease
MTQQERRGWFIVATLFFVLLLVFGSGYSTFAIFLPALLKAFPSWSRARASSLASVLTFSDGISVLPIGWLLDRIEAKVLMILGAIGAGSAFLIASRSNSLAPMIAAYLLLGVALAAATLRPTAFVLANWFEARRGLAMGIAFSGISAGGMTMTLVANHAILAAGWRTAYVTLGLPMIVVGVPLIALTVRSRPPWAAKMTVAQGALLLEGFEPVDALRSRSLWMLIVAHLCFGAGAGVTVHLIAYLEGIGYRAGDAALAMSTTFGLSAFSQVAMGYMADRTGARTALAASFALKALGVVMLLGAAHVYALAVFVLVSGIAAGAPLVLLPMLVAESLGRRRCGTLHALGALGQTLGATLGPVVAGRIFDLTGSYAGAFELFIVVYAIGGVAAFACQPYEQRAQVRIVPASA